MTDPQTELEPVADLPWTTEIDLPYGEHPRIHDQGGRLVAVVGNAEVDRQDVWEQHATMIVNAVNAASELVSLKQEICELNLVLEQTERNAASALASKDAEIAALREALEQIREEGSRVETTRVGDMYAEDGYATSTRMSEEAMIADRVLAELETHNG